MSGHGNPLLQRFDPLASSSQRFAGGGVHPPPTSTLPSYSPTTGSSAQHPTATFSPEQVRILQSQGFSLGMIRALFVQKESFPMRIWILDNSSFMNVRDAHLLQAAAAATVNRNVNLVTRWEELQECVLYHSHLAAQFGLPTRYSLLNAPANSVLHPQYFSMAQTGNLPQEQQILNNVMAGAGAVWPNGPTPLTAQLRILRDYIASIAPQLTSRRQTVPIVIATQGLPTDNNGNSTPQVINEFVEMLRSFEVFPVCVVIRLCTDDDKAFDFYNALDTSAQLSNNARLAMDVLDDYYGEALELYLRNPWLAYGPALHRYREMGFRVAVLDAVDERALLVHEVKDLCHFLFGESNLPDPATNWQAFMASLQSIMAREALVWNPIRRTATPWIDLAQLHDVYGLQQQRSSPFMPSMPSFATGATPTVPPGVPYPNHSQPSFAQTAPPQQTPVPPPPSHQGMNPVGPATTNPATTTDLVKTIETTWAKHPPSFQVTKPLPELLATLPDTFTLVAQPHEHLKAIQPFSTMALSNASTPGGGTSGGSSSSSHFDVLKRAVRKIRFVLHPDRLPHDLTDEQTLLCRTLWDTISEAWDLYSQQNPTAT